MVNHEIGSVLVSESLINTLGTIQNISKTFGQQILICGLSFNSLFTLSVGIYRLQVEQVF